MIQLNDVEARVLGALVEKSLTTPESYPLSMNALVNACNQKTSREPVTNLLEPEVGKGLHSLLERGYALRLTIQGTRVPKFDHAIESLIPGKDPKVVGIICLLLLRGPQTPGELKGRSDRLCQFESTAEVEALLQDLASRPEPMVAKLSRQPGQKELRWRELFTGSAAAQVVETSSVSAVPAPSAPGSRAPQSLEQRVAALEAAVKALEDRLKVS